MNVVAIVAIAGALVTVAACARMLVALKRDEGRDAVAGWFAIMVASGVVVFGLDRFASAFG